MDLEYYILEKNNLFFGAADFMIHYLRAYFRIFWFYLTIALENCKFSNYLLYLMPL